MPWREWRRPGRERNPTPLPIAVCAGEQERAFELRLQPLHSVRGTVRPLPLPRGTMLRFATSLQVGSSGEESDSLGRVPIDVDGAFAVDGLVPHAYHVMLMVPRGAGAGLPDKAPLRVLAVAADTVLDLDVAAALPKPVRGVVRSNVPPGRLAVLSLPGNRAGTSLWGTRHYHGPVAPVGLDGTFRLAEPPGPRALLVVDLWSGVVLHRTPLREAARVDEPAVALEFDARPLDVEVRGATDRARRWLDIVVPAAHWPAGLGGMDALGAGRSECGLGVALPAAPEPFRLWLPEGEVRLVLREGHFVRDDGAEVLVDTRVDTTAARRVVLEPARGSR